MVKTNKTLRREVGFLHRGRVSGWWRLGEPLALVARGSCLSLPPPIWELRTDAGTTPGQERRSYGEALGKRQAAVWMGHISVCKETLLTLERVAFTGKQRSSICLLGWGRFTRECALRSWDGCVVPKRPLRRPTQPEWE